MEGVEVPSFFLCPISLQIMRDPVTLSTGITYDRDSIERWLFSDNHDTCPLTKQSLPPNFDVIPNHTLRRFIQSWCVANATFGVERFPTPKPPVDKTQIAKLLDAAKSPRSQKDSLLKLKAIISESERNKRCVEESGAVDFLASIIRKGISSSTEEELSTNTVESTSTTSDEAIRILYTLKLSEQGRLRLIESNQDFVDSLTKILHGSNYQSKAYATQLLKSLLSVIPPVRLICVGEDLFEGLAKVLRDRISYKATKATLRVLYKLCGIGRNKIKAVNAEIVSVLIELLLDEHEKRPIEMMLVVMDQLCECAEGRAELVGHAAGIAVVSKKMVRVSKLASERSVKILYSVTRFSGTPAVLQEMLQVGAVSKLCLMLQMDCGSKTKERVKEMLRLQSGAWRNTPCISPQLQSSYP